MKRTKYHQKGDRKWENENVDRDKYHWMMIYHVLPVVVEKFPMMYLTRYGVNIQQDGAKAHILDNDPEWLAAVNQVGLKIKQYTQPANSPDLNINNLAFSRSIHSLYYHSSPKDDFDIIDAVRKAFKDYPITKINHMWITLMSVFNQIIEHGGENDYSIQRKSSNDKASFQRCSRLQIMP